MNNKALAISIVIPVYNEKHHLKACLDSISRQTLAPDEVIVVDNNSTDGSVQLAEKYAFVKIVNEQKQGIVYARNRGFNSVTHPLIARIDADTILPATWVARIHSEYHRSQDFAMTGGGYFYNLKFPKLNGWILGQMAYRMNRFIMGHYILWGSNMVIPKELWSAVKDDVCIRNDIHEDLDLAIHLHRKGYKIFYHEDWRVGVEMKRVFTSQRALIKNLLLWPRTLKVHTIRTWPMGYLGAAVLYFGQPLAWLAHLFSKKS